MMEWMNRIISYHPDADAGGGSGADAPTVPADAGTDEVAKWKAEADRRDAIIREKDAKLKKFEDEQAAKTKKLLEEQGKFKELNELLASEKNALAQEAEELRGFKAAIVAAQEAELETLLKDLSDDQKSLVALGVDTAAKIKLANSFKAATNVGSFGPAPRAPVKSAETPMIQYPTMEV
jgi:hypothetical protein